jgi:hypothetical protein
MGPGWKNGLGCDWTGEHRKRNYDNATELHDAPPQERLALCLQGATTPSVIAD